MTQMLEAYPNIPALGCPFDGYNTTYKQPSQFKRMAAIFTDGTYAEPWVEFLETFSSKTKTWGILFEQPIKDTPPAFGVQHGSDVIYCESVGHKGCPKPRPTSTSSERHANHCTLLNPKTFRH